MMYEIRVYKSVEDWHNNKKMVCIQKPWNNALSIPFDSLVHALHFMFGDGTVIDFVVLL